MILFCFGLFHFFFSSPKQKASSYDFLDVESYMLTENLHFTGVGERNELLVKMPVMILPQSSPLAGNYEA